MQIEAQLREEISRVQQQIGALQHDVKRHLEDPMAVPSTAAALRRLHVRLTELQDNLRRLREPQ